MLLYCSVIKHAVWISCRVLPVSITHETEMKVKLQYDGKLHEGCCKKNSFEELPPNFCEVNLNVVQKPSVHLENLHDSS